jgi:hypothetical protein
MAYVENRFGCDVQGAFEGQVCDGIRLSRDSWQIPQPLKIANDVAEVSEPSHNDGLAHSHDVALCTRAA